ncbi:pirin family protein [Cryptosporangium phraense]|uniref:Pirin family protein n=1 Tax=Cryptosporangium phraense TaxID=2593070 RepID=A0A545AHN6_9ACTN|nr:pirin family protein [Cryptosporangium phraense]TQS40842.1 pirin family protein [Cryptosporangium phraense]
MSNLDPAPAESTGSGDATAAPVRELLIGRDVVLGGPRGMSVTRTLPHKHRRMVGAWCFVDHYGPESAVMRVPPHPHTGLQTVSWLLRGEVLHRDSLGSEQMIHPGQLNLMTAGAGISHSEESPAGRTTVLHGAQLWVALPEAARAVAPAFAHHDDLPVVARDGLTATVLMGTLEGATSPATTHTPLVGAEILIDGGGELTLRTDFEYAVLAFEDGPVVDGEPVPAGALVYLGTGRSALPLDGTGRVLLLGGEPFEEQIVMWWNFVGRNHDEIVEFRTGWEAGRGFGEVTGFDGPPLHAPELPTTPLKPRGRTR